MFPLRNGIATNFKISSLDPMASLFIHSNAQSLTLRVFSTGNQKSHFIPSVFIPAATHQLLLPIANSLIGHSTPSRCLHNSRQRFSINNLCAHYFGQLDIPTFLHKNDTNPTPYMRPTLMRRLFSTLLHFLLYRHIISPKQAAASFIYLAHTPSESLNSYNTLPLSELFSDSRSCSDLASSAHHSLITRRAGTLQLTGDSSELEEDANFCWTQIEKLMDLEEKKICEYCEKDLNKKGEWKEHTCYADQFGEGDKHTKRLRVR